MKFDKKFSKSLLKYAELKTEASRPFYSKPLYYYIMLEASKIEFPAARRKLHQSFKLLLHASSLQAFQKFTKNLFKHKQRKKESYMTQSDQ